MKIFVAVPAYDGKLCLQFAQGLLLEEQIALRCGDDFSVNFVSGNAGIVQARNQLATEFLKSSCDRLIFWDSDVTCEAGDVFKLAHHDADIVAGCYRYKLENEAYPVRFLDAPRWSDEKGLLEVESVPTGFLAISRSALEKMVAAHPNRRQNLVGGPTIHAIFQMPVSDNHLYGEDFYFCREWRALGGKVYIDPELTLTHWGFTPTPHKGHIGRWLKAREGIPIDYENESQPQLKETQNG